MCHQPVEIVSNEVGVVQYYGRVFLFSVEWEMSLSRQRGGASFDLVYKEFTIDL